MRRRMPRKVGPPARDWHPLKKLPMQTIIILVVSSITFLHLLKWAAFERISLWYFLKGQISILEMGKNMFIIQIARRSSNLKFNHFELLAFQILLGLFRWIYFQSLEDAGISKDNGKDVFPLATLSSFPTSHLHHPFPFHLHLLPALHYIHHADLLNPPPMRQRLPAPTWGGISRAWAWDQ